MSKLLECVANISEARDKNKTNQIATAVFSTPAVKLLDLHSDPDHNRSVITFAGEIEPVKNAAFKLTQTATELIDINKHKGVHPFLGAVDVLPFVPLKETLMEEAVIASKQLGREIWEKLGIPVYFYGESAEIPYRKNLANVRRGGFHKLKEEIHLPDRCPDLGGCELHPTAGAVTVGARSFLIAFNVNLDSNDLETAQMIAKSIRETHGGLAGVRALGLYLESRDIVQVSISITDHKETSLKTVFDRVAEKADDLGTDILESELVGLIPEEACFPEMAAYLKLPQFSDKKIIEKALV